MKKELEVKNIKICSRKSFTKEELDQLEILLEDLAMIFINEELKEFC